MDRDHASVRGGRPLYQSLYLQVIVAIVVGVLLGYFYPSTGEAMKPLGDAFIKLIKMIIAPIIFCTVVIGIAGMEDMKKVGKTGGYALLYFEVVSTIALLIGLDHHQHHQAGRRDEHRRRRRSIPRRSPRFTKPGALTSTTDFLLNIIPEHRRRCVREGRDPAGPAVRRAVRLRAPQVRRPRHDRVRRHRDASRTCCSRSWAYIMKVAPIGAFGAMAYTIGKFGIALAAVSSAS